MHSALYLPGSGAGPALVLSRSCCQTRCRRCPGPSPRRHLASRSPLEKGRDTLAFGCTSGRLPFGWPRPGGGRAWDASGPGLLGSPCPWQPAGPGTLPVGRGAAPSHEAWPGPAGPSHRRPACLPASGFGAHSITVCSQVCNLLRSVLRRHRNPPCFVRWLTQKIDPQLSRGFAEDPPGADPAQRFCGMSSG